MADHVIKLRDGAVRHNDINTNKVSAEDLEWKGAAMKKIKNPLIRRIPKELIGDWKKYLVVFPYFLLTSSISFKISLEVL